MQHRARKRFGQNFLHDANVIGKIVAAIAPRAADRLVEIGPGLGALTTPLLDRLDALDAIELDRDLVPGLAELPGAEKLTVHQTDALKFDFAALRGDDASPRLRVVGNLPYNISSPLIFHLLGFSEHIRDMHFMLQKEVVQRLAAKPGNGDYGRLSVAVQAQCRVENLFTVPPGCFHPPPKVESAIVRLTPLETPLCPRELQPALEDLLRQAFGQRRKTLRNNLKGTLSAEAIETCGIDPALRPERLSVEDFVRLVRAL
ncbi:MAG: 16S rRNA (adenine(1518)-N(6)/adenine(1519)-N(6))-dimethyltransferase RsmA [Pseudomonadota bacterium]